MYIPEVLGVSLEQSTRPCLDIFFWFSFWFLIYNCADLRLCRLFFLYQPVTLCSFSKMLDHLCFLFPFFSSVVGGFLSDRMRRRKPLVVGSGNNKRFLNIHPTFITFKWVNLVWPSKQHLSYGRCFWVLSGDWKSHSFTTFLNNLDISPVSHLSQCL